MSYNRNHRNRWYYKERRKLESMLRQNYPLIVIRLKLGRTESSIRSAAARFGFSLRLSNQRPYGKRRR
jgi:hypothetical protein